MDRQDIYKLRSGRTALSPRWAKLIGPHLKVSWQELIEGAPIPAAISLNMGVKPDIEIPELDVRAMAGGGADDQPLDSNGQNRVIANWTLPIDFLRSYTTSPSAVRIIRIVGDSMEPHYLAGDRVLVDTSHVIPSPPGVYVIWDGFGLVLKHLEVMAGKLPAVVRLSSDNPAYAPYEVPVSDLKVQGRVMGKWVWK